jgi:hypothetical protein
MARWLSPRLPTPQLWILHDRDPDLLEVAAESLLAEGVRAETRLGDLNAADLTGASLVTASALLDILTFEEIDGLARAVTAAGCPALLTLTVIGRVDLTPWEPMDNVLCDGFNDHLSVRRHLGSRAADAAAEAFRRHGATVLVRETPWRLGADHSELIAEWLRGFVPAAAAQLPVVITDAVEAYLDRRLAQAAAGELRVTVEHLDLLAVPSPGGAA